MEESKNRLKESYESGTKAGTREDVRAPSLYRVYLLNDNYTTMDFVISILESIFHKTTTEANQLMLQIHKRGSGLCGIYTKDIAETKVASVHEIAEKSEYPLKCVMEEE